MKIGTFNQDHATRQWLCVRDTICVLLHQRGAVRRLPLVWPLVLGHVGHLSSRSDRSLVAVLTVHDRHPLGGYMRVRQGRLLSPIGFRTNFGRIEVALHDQERHVGRLCSGRVGRRPVLQCEQRAPDHYLHRHHSRVRHRVSRRGRDARFLTQHFRLTYVQNNEIINAYFVKFRASANGN